MDPNLYCVLLLAQMKNGKLQVASNYPDVGTQFITSELALRFANCTSEGHVFEQAVRTHLRISSFGACNLLGCVLNICYSACFCSGEWHRGWFCIGQWRPGSVWKGVHRNGVPIGREESAAVAICAAEVGRLIISPETITGRLKENPTKETLSCANRFTSKSSPIPWCCVVHSCDSFILQTWWWHATMMFADICSYFLFFKKQTTGKKYSYFCSSSEVCVVQR